LARAWLWQIHRMADPLSWESTIPDLGALPTAWVPDWTLPGVRLNDLECALRNTFVLR